MVEVIKVIDLENVPAHMKEIMFAKINNINPEKMTELFQIAQVFGVKVVDMGTKTATMECVQTETKNNEMIKLLKAKFSTIEIVRGGNVAIESVSVTDRY